MSPAEIRHVLVVGAGEMGSGIAQTVAAAGFETTVAARTAATVEHARTRLARWVERGKLSPDAFGREDVIFASTTSQFPITRLAAVTRRPDRVIDTHWFNPPPVMKLIEVVRGDATSDATLAIALALCERYGKETVVCRLAFNHAMGPLHTADMGGDLGRKTGRGFHAYQG